MRQAENRALAKRKNQANSIPTRFAMGVLLDRKPYVVLHPILSLLKFIL
jgi:hypothetical protein